MIKYVYIIINYITTSKYIQLHFFLLFIVNILLCFVSHFKQLMKILHDRKKKNANWIYVTVFGKTNRLVRKSNFCFIALLPFTSSEDDTVQI